MSGFHSRLSELRKLGLLELGFPAELADALVDFTSPRTPRALPAPELLKELPGETDDAWGKRLKREWRRETSRPRRSSAISEEQMIEDTYAILGVR